MSELDNEQRITRLETSVSNLTQDVQELTLAIKEHIQSQASTISALTEKISSLATPNWQHWIGFIGILLTSLTIIFLVLQQNQGYLEKDVSQVRREIELKDELLLLQIDNTKLEIENRISRLPNSN